jgi:hypothetical protein
MVIVNIQRIPRVLLVHALNRDVWRDEVDSESYSGRFIFGNRYVGVPLTILYLLDFALGSLWNKYSFHLFLSTRGTLYVMLLHHYLLLLFGCTSAKSSTSIQRYLRWDYPHWVH